MLFKSQVENCYNYFSLKLCLLMRLKQAGILSGLNRIILSSKARSTAPFTALAFDESAST